LPKVIRQEVITMTGTRPSHDDKAKPSASKPNEFTAVAPGFSGKVSNRPTPTGASVTEFDRAVEEERQADA
jgi:hypothetical protein